MDYRFAAKGGLALCAGRQDRILGTALPWVCASSLRVTLGEHHHDLAPLGRHLIVVGESLPQLGLQVLPKVVPAKKAWHALREGNVLVPL